MKIGGTLLAGPAEAALHGVLQVPGDKSMSHRSVMMAAVADGVTEISGFLPGEDCLATASMFECMGVSIEWLNAEKTALRVQGAGLHGLQAPDRILDAGNSGTCARLMLGLLAGQPFASTLTGDESLRRRPMRRVIEPLRRMGANITASGDGDLLPLTIQGGSLSGIDFESEVASAQVKSCVLLAGLYARGDTRVREPRPTRDHTERMLPLFGQPVGECDGWIVLHPSGELRAPEDVLTIPADPSSAAFFAVAATIVPGSEVMLTNIGINPRRDGWRRILTAMGADLETSREYAVGEEPVADIRACCRQKLAGVKVAALDVPDAIDEFPILFVAASLADGVFMLRGASELRVKESDRIAVMAGALRAMGAEIEEWPDGLQIHGRPRLKGGVEVDAHGDHRVAMAMAVAAQMADAPVLIHNAAAIATSFPGFVEQAQSIGMNVRWLEE
ncbi:MAG: 3-phosphoshikimate 1-carboxyvinyltransferase [Zetaproteobacteria bacterium]|nr:MAG: 3-phosphoshikimate 1-carboxyvinyltransferase [Zetaproteobacteria bacterium]